MKKEPNKKPEKAKRPEPQLATTPKPRVKPTKKVKEKVELVEEIKAATSNIEFQERITELSNPYEKDLEALKLHKEIRNLKKELEDCRGLLENAELNISSVNSLLHRETWKLNLWIDYKATVSNSPWYKLLWWRIKGEI